MSEAGSTSSGGSEIPLSAMAGVGTKRGGGPSSSGAAWRSRGGQEEELRGGDLQADSDEALLDLTDAPTNATGGAARSSPSSRTQGVAAADEFAAPAGVPCCGPLKYGHQPWDILPYHPSVYRRDTAQIFNEVVAGITVSRIMVFDGTPNTA